MGGEDVSQLMVFNICNLPPNSGECKREARYYCGLSIITAR